jgi:hypothetical protein
MRHRYVPGTGELCDFLDCGGGTAPPKTTVPGCLLYSGTATYSPSYLAGYGPNGQSPATSSSAAASTASTGAANTVTSATDSLTTPAATLGSNATGHGSSTATLASQSQNAGNGVSGALAAVGGAFLGVIAML